MKDFTVIAPHVGGSMRRLEELLHTHAFRHSESLSPALSGGYSSETWLRREGSEFLAVRIDWLGHRHVPQAHYHFEAFPVDRRFEYEHALAFDNGVRRSIGIRRFDPLTGKPATRDPHAPLIRDDR
jgi:hypothetical protein